MPLAAFFSIKNSTIFNFHENEKIDNKGDLQHDNDGCKDKLIKMNYHLIEKVMKTFKTHRNTKDFDTKFIKNLKLDNDKATFISEIVTTMKKIF
jgi:hypothetical protein